MLQVKEPVTTTLPIEQRIAPQEMTQGPSTVEALERRLAEVVCRLTEALEQQTATAEICR